MGMLSNKRARVSRRNNLLNKPIDIEISGCAFLCKGGRIWQEWKVQVVVTNWGAAVKASWRLSLGHTVTQYPKTKLLVIPW